jgi:hypothetical protein
MRIHRRLILLTLVCTAGGALFAPFVLAGLAASGTAASAPASVLFCGFALASGLVGGLCAWAGLRLADRAQLPMPLFRAWEIKEPVPPGAWRQILWISLIAGFAAGLGVVAMIKMIHGPHNPGSLAVRLLTVFFAASVPEILAHLFAMSGLRLLFNRTWPAILLSSLLFVLIFHGGHIGNAAVTALVMGANFLFGTLTGWLYSRYGFESAMLTQAIGHLLALGIN